MLVQDWGQVPVTAPLFIEWTTLKAALSCLGSEFVHFQNRSQQPHANFTNGT